MIGPVVHLYLRAVDKVEGQDPSDVRSDFLPLRVGTSPSRYGFARCPPSLTEAETITGAWGKRPPLTDCQGPSISGSKNPQNPCVGKQSMQQCQHNAASQCAKQLGCRKLPGNIRKP